VCDVLWALQFKLTLAQVHPPTSAHPNQNEEMDQERRRSTSTPPRTSISDDAQPAQPTPVAAMEPEDVEAEKVFLGGLDL
jgi:hypothetical protein